MPRDADRAAILEAVGRSVHVRFGLSADAFADHVIERIPARVPAGDRIRYAAGLCLDDLYLATACSRGDEAAWRECEARYFEYIRRFTRRFVNERAAVDVADAVIADLWQRSRLAQYNGRSSLLTWLGAVAAHAAINAGKTEDRRATLAPDAMEQLSRGAAGSRSDSAEDVESHRVFTGLINRALAGLDPEEKLLLLMYYEQRLTLDQMEGVLGASKATLSRRLDRLRKRIRESIETTAREQLNVSADTLRERLDFARLEFDLVTALGGGSVKGGGGGVV
jgi:RNA polymerase sigma-70 factor, ECF subfamily